MTDKRIKGVIFHNDPLPEVMKSLGQNQGKDPVLNNTFYGKLATSVVFDGDISGMLAMLVMYARADFLVSDIRNLLVNKIVDQVNASRQRKVTPEHLAELALRRVDEKTPLVYNGGKASFKINPNDRALLLKAYPVFAKVQNVRG
jgi:hypothetical protein